ncbi:MAG: hypothetical protein M3273_00295 [Actinomycetota bacterium]|nr:hypothetical protein [Actinomycetota bacterium]
MRNPLGRRTALALTLSMLGALAVAPTTAAAGAVSSPTCKLILQTTPGIEVDTNDDGYPEYRAPRIHDVTLCWEATAGYVTFPPTIENCSAAPKSVRCMAVRISVLPAQVSAHAYAELCFTVEGDYAPTCNHVDSGAIDWTEPRVICIGYDLDGGHPCDGAMFSLE